MKAGSLPAVSGVKLQFTSLLSPSYQESVEELLFLHPQQGRFRDTILDCIAAHGVPRVVARSDGLRVELGGQTPVQTLYALTVGLPQDEVIGCVVYTRNAAEELEILHIAVRDDYTVRGCNADQQVTFALIQELCSVARRIKGVSGVRLAYKRGRSLLKAVHPLTFDTSRPGNDEGQRGVGLE